MINKTIAQHALIDFVCFVVPKQEEVVNIIKQAVKDVEYGEQLDWLIKELSETAVMIQNLPLYQVEKHQRDTFGWRVDWLNDLVIELYEFGSQEMEEMAHDDDHYGWWGEYR